MFNKSIYLEKKLMALGVCLSMSLSAPLFANTKANTFINNANGSVTDTATGLTWQRQDDNVPRTHANAITYCQGLTLASKSDWRLPNIKELMSIVDYRVDSPSTDDAMFPGTNSLGYWSASSQAGSSGSAWLVSFLVGNVSSGGKANGRLVRCVR